MTLRSVQDRRKTCLKNSHKSLNHFEPLILYLLLIAYQVLLKLIANRYGLAGTNILSLAFR